jgi:hypothetical protein
MRLIQSLSFHFPVERGASTWYSEISNLLYFPQALGTWV